MRNKISSYVMQKKVWYNNVWKTGNLCNNKGCKWGKVMRKKKDDLSTKKQSNANSETVFLHSSQTTAQISSIEFTGIM